MAFFFLIVWLNFQFIFFVVITGGSNGIGLQYARFFAQQGLNVAIIAINDEQLEQTSKEIQQQYGVQVKKIPIDFSEGFGVYKLIEEKLINMEIGVLGKNIFSWNIWSAQNEFNVNIFFSE